MKNVHLKQMIMKCYEWMNRSKILLCIRSGLAMLIPVLLIGSFALVFRSLPIPAYQEFIHSFLSGAIDLFFYYINSATFGILSIYFLVSISLCYSQQIFSERRNGYGTVFASLIAFVIFSGSVTTEGLEISNFGVTGLFTAIVCALGASFCYEKFSKSIRKFAHYYTAGEDDTFHDVLMTLIPILGVSIVFSAINAILAVVFDVSSFHTLCMELMNKIFSNMGRSLWTALLFEFLLHLLWFFGIHGSNVLEPVCQQIFVPALEVNQELIAEGLPATEIYSKTFFDVFVIMGGCGSVMCLLIAVLLFSKRRSNRNLSKLATIPMIFNINEIMVFGMPIVLNGIFLIPFLLTPMLFILTSTFAMKLGLVPIPVNHVEWTTPILWSGYLATGSVSGIVLQLINLFLGVMIYRPFIKIYDEERLKNAHERMNRLVSMIKESEESRKPLRLLSLTGEMGVIVKNLVDDFEYYLISQKPKLFYQPQFDQNSKCIGVEALLRWKHPLYGMVYPPLVVQIAEETENLLRLEENIFRTVYDDLGQLIEIIGEDAKISINVTGHTIQVEEFEQFLFQLKEEYPEYCRNVMVEITEQATLLFRDELVERLSRIKDMGYRLAIDDFSMGNTSVKYLQTNVFDVVKLDGSLTKDILYNDRTRDIIESITKLSHNFNIQVIAEFVETKEQRNALEKAGCYLYQGYLYSPAASLDTLAPAISKSEDIA